MFHKSVFLCQTSFSFSEGDISVVILYEKNIITLLYCNFIWFFRLLSQTTGKRLYLAETGNRNGCVTIEIYRGRNWRFNPVAPFHLDGL